MTAVFFAAAVFAALVIIYGSGMARGRRRLCAVLLAALALRLVLAACFQGFPSDYTCFYSWARMAFENGLRGFYDSGVFADYPPGYIYVLWAVGLLLDLFGADYLSAASFLIVKLPAILCDIAGGALICRLAAKRRTERAALFAAALYVFNPAVIFNSSIWGQVDAVMCLALLEMCALLTEKKTIRAYFVFALGILLKPQMLIFTPVLIYGIVESVILENFSWKRFRDNLYCGLAAILAMALLCVPFGGPGKIIRLYTQTMSSYPYATVNAYNFWALVDKNWASQDGTFLAVKYSTWGTVAIVLAVALSAWLFFKSGKKQSRYFTAAAVLILVVFLFAVRMHERYMFPALALILSAWALRPLKSFLAAYAVLSAVQLYNTVDVLLMYSVAGYQMNQTAMRIVSGIMVAAGLWFLYRLYRADVRNAEPPQAGSAAP